jgi:hypothetical protein
VLGAGVGGGAGVAVDVGMGVGVLVGEGVGLRVAVGEGEGVEVGGLSKTIVALTEKDAFVDCTPEFAGKDARSMITKREIIMIFFELNSSKGQHRT